MVLFTESVYRNIQLHKAVREIPADDSWDGLQHRQYQNTSADWKVKIAYEGRKPFDLIVTRNLLSKLAKAKRLK